VSRRLEISDLLGKVAANSLAKITLLSAVKLSMALDASARFL
jgi:hypothetical protein